MKYYLEEHERVFEQLGASPDGLTTDEAEKRLLQYGENKLTEGKKTSLLKRFLAQLADPMIIILIVAAVISAITSAYSGESFADVFVIMFVVVINAVLGVVQESKAEKAIDALKEMSASVSRVLRDGNITNIRSELLVPGDVILLEAGNAIPADCRLFECASLKIEEAALTGESVPSEKTTERLGTGEGGDVSLGDRRNMVYMGGTAVYGRGKAIVVATGMKTEMGKIADAIENAEEGLTPLQIKLNQLSRILTILVLGICAFIFVFHLIRGGELNGAVLLDTFMIAVSLAVAAIPEGLVAVVTIVLSIGVTRMAKRNAIIRRLTAVETLGCTQVICSDKTGTLTQNKMTVVEYYGEDRTLLASAMSLCSDAEPDGKGGINGEPTEAALVYWADSIGLPKSELNAGYPRVSEAPFDSMRKMMSTIHRSSAGIVQYTKGAPDEVLKRCTAYYSGGGVHPMTDEKREEIIEENRAMAGKALRVLSAAYKTYKEVPTSSNPATLEAELVFLGLAGMIDPVRPEAVVAIEQCKQAGIRAVMITGDHRDTAVAIASNLGILEDSSQAITGAALDDFSDEELAARISDFSVYARVQPEHKVRIVKAWQESGMVTAMTGDGVNDAPSIKTADIGVGMGITGTDVTKNVADMVLADDNFATIVSAVEEGRRIYANIRKAIQFLLSSNLSEVLCIFTATIFGFTILRPTHILWINLITDCFPALALGLEAAEKDVMRLSPRSSKAGIFSGGVGVDVFYQGVLVTVITLAAYFIGHYIELGNWGTADSANGMTMAFLAMSMSEIFHSFNMRSQRGSVFTLKKQNVFLFGAMVLSLILSTTVIYVPFLANLFQFSEITMEEYFISLGLAFSVIPIVEIVKLFQRRFGKAV